MKLSQLNLAEEKAKIESNMKTVQETIAREQEAKNRGRACKKQKQSKL